MPISNTIKIALASAVGAVVVSSTVLFPLIKDINKTISDEKIAHNPTDAESNKSEQVITKEQTTSSNTATAKENPSVHSNSISSTNDPKMHGSDTIKSNLLIEDIPHYKRN
jgi:hypothetical protein